MKSWMRWVVAALLSVAASSAFADGSCQPGFGLRSYPFYDKAGAYIGMRQACAPIPCTPGYQDSTCAAPLRNGAIPQPQCQPGAGWTTVAAAVWQGSRWSDPQCGYQAPPTCPPGYTQASSPSWNGSGWVGLQCTPSTPPAPNDGDLAKICSQVAVSKGYNLTPANEDPRRRSDADIFIASDRTPGGSFVSQSSVGPVKDNWWNLCQTNGRPDAVTQCWITPAGQVTQFLVSYSTCVGG